MDYNWNIKNGVAVEPSKIGEAKGLHGYHPQPTYSDYLVDTEVKGFFRKWVSLRLKGNFWNEELKGFAKLLKFYKAPLTNRQKSKGVLEVVVASPHPSDSDSQFILTGDQWQLIRWEIHRTKENNKDVFLDHLYWINIKELDEEASSSSLQHINAVYRTSWKWING